MYISEINIIQNASWNLYFGKRIQRDGEKEDRGKEMINTYGGYHIKKKQFNME